MFSYVDPVGTGTLERLGALQHYQANLHALYVQEAQKPDSAFTLLSAFDGIREDPEVRVDSVDWIAYPKLARATDEQIDTDRFRRQDEYVEWRIERDANGNVQSVTFTTEFFEILQASAEVGEQALLEGIQEILPAANPTTVELFGPNFDPAAVSTEARGLRFADRRRSNPWVNGQKGILCLGHENNTAGALFTLVGDCGIATGGNPADVCQPNFCVPGRNSDPSVCTAVQQLAQSDRVFSLIDPAGIRIKELRGIWKIDGRQININDPDTNQGVWIVSRNGRRATLTATGGLTIVDDPIISGAQVAKTLAVEASVISAPESKTPAWAKTGHESTRMIG